MWRGQMDNDLPPRLKEWKEWMHATDDETEKTDGLKTMEAIKVSVFITTLASMACLLHSWLANDNRERKLVIRTKR